MQDSDTQRLLGLVCRQSNRVSSKMANNKVIVLDESESSWCVHFKDPEKCIVEELRRWLECHGVQKSWEKRGKRFIQRVKD